ncbi:MAG: ubiquinone/menaquinone biosynthesis methyltransferase [Ignavibacteriae bacterium]|nr:MAG: ubiquinone/menaquinone biosynthesis methyltransferase [Ignavibacteriota bacterium]
MSEAVHAMFSDIAARYDRANAILSLGIHHLWRKATVKASGARPGMRVLDCATGTGDLAIEFAKAVGGAVGGAVGVPVGGAVGDPVGGAVGVQALVLGTDFNADMLQYAPQKSAAKGLNIQFEVADAMNLPYEDDRFDIASISFGIRNVDDPMTALKSMARVVKSGGKVVVLEFGQPTGVFGKLYRWYSKNIIPVIGTMITGHREAYDYLPRTAAKFPAGEKFVGLMLQSGVFSDVQARPLTGGIAWLYVGTVA